MKIISHMKAESTEIGRLNLSAGTFYISIDGEVIEEIYTAQEEDEEEYEDYYEEDDDEYEEEY